MFSKVLAILSCTAFAVAFEDDPGFAQECKSGICGATDDSAMLQIGPRALTSSGWGWINVTNFTKFHNYSGNLSVSGWMLVRPISWWPVSPFVTGHALNWKFSGVDPRCFHGPLAYNDDSCGVHVHEGESCQEDPGPRLFFKELNRDPWPCVTYKTEVNSNETFTPWLGVKVFDGIGDYTFQGRTIIVKDFDGVKIGCAVIVDSPEPSRRLSYNTTVAEPVPDKKSEGVPSRLAMTQTSDITGLPAKYWKPYYRYDGDLNISGYVWVRQNPFVERGIGHFLTWKLSGVDPECDKGPGSEPNSCAIILFTGKSCETDPGVPFWDDHTIEWTNPWTCSAYTTLEKYGDSNTEAPGFLILTGLSLRDTDGHAMIMHSFHGHRIACSTIGW